LGFVSDVNCIADVVFKVGLSMKIKSWEIGMELNDLLVCVLAGIGLAGRPDTRGTWQ